MFVIFVLWMLLFMFTLIVIYKTTINGNLLIININQSTNWRQLTRYISWILFISTALIYHSQTDHIVLSLILFIITLFTLSSTMEIEHSFSKITAIRNPEMNLNTYLYITYNYNQLNIMESHDFHNVHITYEFIKIQVGSGKQRHAKYKVAHFNIKIYQDNSVIYDKHKDHFHAKYSIQEFFASGYIDVSNFIKIALNDAINHIIHHNNEICAIINCSKEL